MADKIPKNFNREAFKEALAYVESSGGKFLENSTSSAVGKYQFLWKYIQSDPMLKGVTKRQFINSDDLQEQVMDAALNGKLKGFPNYIENAKRLKSEFNSDLRVDEIALLTHFLGSGGVKEQLKSGAYKVPGQNMSVDGYTGKYNKYLEKMGLNGGQSLVQNAPQEENNIQQELPQENIQEDPYNLQQRGSQIGMDNAPYASEPQRDPFAEAQNLGGVEEMESIRPELRVTVEDDVNAFRGLMEQNQEAFNVQQAREQNAPLDPRKIQRIKNMLSPKEEESGYYEEFENTEDPANNIVGNNSFAYGGYVNQNRYVDGGDPIDPPEEEVVKTVGTTTTNTSFENITNENGLQGIRRNVTSNTPDKTVITTPAGDEAYAALSQEDRDAQDAKYRELYGNTSSTESDETFFLNPMQSEGINLRGMAGGTELPNIGDVPMQQEPKREPMYHIAGNSIHNSRFGGHESSMITYDGSIKNDISHILSPGDISKNSPMSGRRNEAIHRQLTEAEQDAHETKYANGWFRPIPADIGAKMIAKEAEDDAEIEARNLSQHNQIIARKDEIATMQQEKATEREAILQNQQAKLQARKDAAAKKQAEAAAKRQAVKESREQNSMAKGGMIKRADGSYSKRGLWDNIRANRGSGKNPTAEMLKQERRINAKAYGGSVETEDSENFVAFEGGGTHEQNPLGGIPQGMGSNGKLNTVEEGETKVTIDGEEYIFSQRGMLDGSGFESQANTNQFGGGGNMGYGYDKNQLAQDKAIDAIGMGADAAGSAAGDAAGAAGGAGAGMGAAGAAAGAVSAGLELIPDDTTNHSGVEGIQETGNLGLAAAKGAASGAASGASAGPWGMAAGAVIGGTVALIGGAQANKKTLERNKQLFAQANPALQNQNYGGGYLRKKKSTKKSRVKKMLRNK